jgi:hypothetical protein
MAHQREVVDGLGIEGFAEGCVVCGDGRGAG